MAGSVYKFEDVYSFLVPEKMPPFWVEMAGVSYCNGYYHIDREESDVKEAYEQDPKTWDTLFQFGHLNYGRADKFTPKQGSLTQLWNCMRYWVETMEKKNLLFSIFTDNHDNGWLLERLGSRDYRYESASCIAAMMYLCRGVCFIYQGQELGMLNPSYDTIEDFRDVESMNMYDELCRQMSREAALQKINFGSRDNQRRPFCWDGSEYAGFSTAEPWIPVHSEYQACNLTADQKAEKSVWRFYRDLLHLRHKHPALTVGGFMPVAPRDTNYCAFTRTQGNEQFLVVCNFETAQTLQIPNAYGKLALSNYGIQEKTDNLYAPYEVAVFRRIFNG